MYTIEPKRITTMTAVITLDETQIAALVADPAPLLDDLRSLLKQWKAPQPKEQQNGNRRRAVRPNWATDGHAHPKPRRARKAAEKNRPAGRRASSAARSVTRISSGSPSTCPTVRAIGTPSPCRSRRARRISNSVEAGLRCAPVRHPIIRRLT